MKKSVKSSSVQLTSTSQMTAFTLLRQRRFDRTVRQNAKMIPKRNKHTPRAKNKIYPPSRPLHSCSKRFYLSYDKEFLRYLPHPVDMPQEQRLQPVFLHWPLLEIQSVLPGVQCRTHLHTPAPLHLPTAPGTRGVLSFTVCSQVEDSRQFPAGGVLSPRFLDSSVFKQYPAITGYSLLTTNRLALSHR